MKYLHAITLAMTSNSCSHGWSSVAYMDRSDTFHLFRQNVKSHTELTYKMATRLITSTRYVTLTQLEPQSSYIRYHMPLDDNWPMGQGKVLTVHTSFPFDCFSVNVAMHSNRSVFRTDSVVLSRVLYRRPTTGDQLLTETSLACTDTFVRK